MKKTCGVMVNGQFYEVLISDEPEALLAAKAAGRAVLGVGEPCADFCPWLSTFLINWEEVSGERLQMIAERMVRREKGLPWNICETERLLIREAELEDFEKLFPFQQELTAGMEPENMGAFKSQEDLQSYIFCQYGFFEYGLWILEEKKSGCLVGTAGVWNPDDTICDRLKLAGEYPDEYLEMGYHIFSPYRRKGLAREAGQAVMAYTDRELECKICLQIAPSNPLSCKVAESLGFWRLFTHTDIEETGLPYLYGWSCQ